MANKLSRLERYGLGVFQQHDPAAQARLEVAPLEERVVVMRRVANMAVARAAAAGVLSGLATAIAAYIADPLLGPHGSVAPRDALIAYWTTVLGVTVIASVLEIGFLYWDGLRAARKLHDLANAKSGGVDAQAQELLRLSMVRAALEIPNPREPFFGIDPLRGASRLSLLVAGLIYKLKVGLSSFLVKAAIKRLGGRMIARGWLEFFAIPVLAVWNGVVCHWYMREARMRALGPLFAASFLELITDVEPRQLDGSTVRSVLRALAATILANRGVHPSILLCVNTVSTKTGVTGVDDIDNPERFLDDLKVLPKTSQAITLEALYVAAALNGHVNRAEKRLIYAAQDACSTPRSLAAVNLWNARLTAGQLLTRRTAS